MKRIILNRDDVHPADEPMRSELELDDQASFVDVLKEVNRLNYLPNIAGGKATWSAWSSMPLAIVAQEWDQPKLFVYNTNLYLSELAESQTSTIHFNYHAQIDPDVVYQVLWGLTLSK